MSGHSKWSTIKHKKAQQDQKRGKIFSRLSKEIAVAVREAGTGDPDKNPRLRTALDRAREANMPSDNIERAIDRGLGKGSGQKVEEVIYEGYGPNGIAVMVVTETDNRQRTSAELKYAFDEAGGSLGGPGSAAYLFKRKNGEFEPKVRLPLGDKKAKEKLSNFFDRLRAHEDVVGVYSNAEEA